jgi:hypothetical protein
MTRFFLALAVAGTTFAGAAVASELTPGNGYSLRLGAYDGALYYSVADGDFRVVATLASGDAVPIRMISTLMPGQSVMLSVPRGPGEAPMELAIVRDGDTLRLEDTSAAAVTPGMVAPLQAALEEELRGR